MNNLLLVPILTPLLAALGVALLPERAERSIVRVSYGASLLLGASVLAMLTQHLSRGALLLELPLFTWGHETFLVRFFSDAAGLVFLAMTAFFFGVVVRFSQRYLHNEPGYRRFFTTMLVFVSGMSALSLAGDLETLFIGWEVVGLSSFLLIGFYRQRTQSVNNAQKAYAVYRVSDVGLLVGAYLEHKMLAGHAFWGSGLHGPALVSTLGEATLLGLSLLLLLAAAGKSAQAPFTFWLPRAMEGPTPSSAIFYGALSVHAGVLLLYRTQEIWQTSVTARVLVGVVGAVSAIMATLSGRVQSTIKGQIAYASVTQVGIMFVELALGLPTLALIHMVANASLRCYQLLVSPSVVAYLLRRQSTSSEALHPPSFVERFAPKRLRSTLYVLASSEGYLEYVVQALVTRPLTRASSWLRARLSHVALFIALFAAAIMTQSANLGVTVLLGAFALLGAVLALTMPSLERAWLCASGSYLGVGMNIALTGSDAAFEVASFILGVIVFAGLGYVLLTRARPRPFLVFLCLLGLIGFPLSPVFFGEDLLLDAALRLSVAFPIVVTAAFVLNGIGLMRAYAQTFFKQEGALASP